MTPAGFHSRDFNSAEKNYPAHDKEILAIVKKFEPQLTGTKFEILTYPTPLTNWKGQMVPSLAGSTGINLSHTSRQPFAIYAESPTPRLMHCLAILMYNLTKIPQFAQSPKSNYYLGTRRQAFKDAIEYAGYIARSIK